FDTHEDSPRLKEVRRRPAPIDRAGRVQCGYGDPRNGFDDDRGERQGAIVFVRSRDGRVAYASSPATWRRGRRSAGNIGGSARRGQGNRYHSRAAGLRRTWSLDDPAGHGHTCRGDLRTGQSDGQEAGADGWKRWYATRPHGRLRATITSRFRASHPGMAGFIA